jgi:hypothetical protein
MMTAAKCHKCESLKPLLVIMQKVRRKGGKVDCFPAVRRVLVSQPMFADSCRSTAEVQSQHLCCCQASV